jgi:hypothetical protein
MRQGWGGRPVRVETGARNTRCCVGRFSAVLPIRMLSRRSVRHSMQQPSNANRFSRNRRAGRGRP